MKSAAPQFDYTDPLGLAVFGSHSADINYNQNLINFTILRSTEKINQLEPETKQKCIEMFRAAFQTGYLMLVYSSLRTFDHQQDLYNKYLQGGNLAAPAGNSYHNYGYAFDCGIVNPKGDGLNPKGYALLQIINNKLKLGLTWGGEFQQVDKPHFQYEKYSIDNLRTNSQEYQNWFEQQGKPTQAEITQWQDLMSRYANIAKDYETTWFRRNIGYIIPGSIITLGVTLLILAIMRYKSES